MNNTIQITISREALEGKRKIAAQNGFILAKDTGTAEHSGVKIDYRYADGVLDISVLHKPLVVPESFVEHEIRQFFL